MSVWAVIIFVLLLLMLSGFFSGSETALTALSRARVHQLEKAGERRAALLRRLLDAKERLIGTLLLGNNIVNILASALAASLFIRWFGEAGVVYATIVMTALVLVFAEVLPKTWAITVPDRFAVAVAPIVSVFVRLLGPITMLVEALVSRMLGLFGVTALANPLVSGHDELRGTVDFFHREGIVRKRDRDMLEGLLDLAELAVSDVMVHRTNMNTIDADDPNSAIVEAVLASPHTRIPLWRGDRGNIVGILHTKDLLRALAAARGDAAAIDIVGVAAPPWFVPETTPLQTQLTSFLRRKAHFALVVDEYGEVMGLVTLEDILEEIVGDIADEHDVVVEGVRPQPDGSVLVDGWVPVRDLNRAFDWSLPDEEATTVAGLVIHEAGTIPEPGQEFTFSGCRFKLLSKSGNRLTQLHVIPLQTPPAGPT